MTLEALLSTLSTTEKIQAMSILRRDLSKTPADIVSPEWHGETLASVCRKIVKVFMCNDLQRMLSPKIAMFLPLMFLP